MSELAMPRSWRRETKPHKFCPGCGHGLVLKALGMAVDRLEIAERVLFGCDIGCSLLAWDFFNLDTVQTHHGRTVPFIVGAKRARPHLIGIAYMGDGGGYAIGVQHLINAVMRNDRILVIIVNNTTYAMTGGQMAPTSLPGQKTETSPGGREPRTEGYPSGARRWSLHLPLKGHISPEVRFPMFSVLPFFWRGVFKTRFRIRVSQ